MASHTTQSAPRARTGNGRGQGQGQEQEPEQEQVQHVRGGHRGRGGSSGNNSGRGYSSAPRQQPQQQYAPVQRQQYAPAPQYVPAPQSQQQYAPAPRQQYVPVPRQQYVPVPQYAPVQPQYAPVQPQYAPPPYTQQQQQYVPRPRRTPEEIHDSYCRRYDKCKNTLASVARTLAKNLEEKAADGTLNIDREHLIDWRNFNYDSPHAAAYAINMANNHKWKYIKRESPFTVVFDMMKARGYYLKSKLMTSENSGARYFKLSIGFDRDAVPGAHPDTDEFVTEEDLGEDVTDDEVDAADEQPTVPAKKSAPATTEESEPSSGAKKSTRATKK